MTLKAVVFDPNFPDVSVETAQLAECGVRVFHGEGDNEAGIISAAHDADAILTGSCNKVTRLVIEHLGRCRIIAQYGIGVDNIDLPAATEHGIYVSNVTDHCLDEVSNHALALILACGRKVVQLDVLARNGRWEWKAAKPLFPFRGALVGLVGFGRIARALVSKVRVLGMEVLVYDPFVEAEEIRRADATVATLEKLLASSDFVSVHLPLNPQTRAMFSDALFRQMKRTAYFVNTSRGGLVDEAALDRALSEGWIAGAGLDVMASEPPRMDNPLLRLPNCIFTPHVGFYSEHSVLELRRRAAGEVRRVISGSPPQSLINRSVIPRNPA